MLRIVALGLALYALYAVAMVVLHPRYIYPFSPAVFADPAFSQMVLADGTTVYVARGAPEAARVLYFVGNVGSLTAFAPMLDHHRAAGRSVVALAYPGAGGVPGAPSEEVLKGQAVAAYDALSDLLPDATGPLTVQGYSLGTGLAVHVAAVREPDRLLLTAPYTRLCRLMAARSWLPACQLPFVQKWDTLAEVDQVGAPVLVLHGAADGLIPMTEGVALAEALPDATFLAIDGAGHSDLMQYPTYLTTLDAFIDGGVRP